MHTSTAIRSLSTLLSLLTTTHALPNEYIAPFSLTVPPVDSGLSDGPAALRKAYLKYGATLPNALIPRAADAIQALSGSVTATPDQYDSIYLSPVTIGSPAASASTYQMILDTGASDTSVYAPKLGKSGSSISTTVTVGGVAVKNQVVNLIADSSGGSNVLGMSCIANGNTAMNNGQTWYTNAVSQGLPAIFAANLKPAAPGTFTLGYIDSSMYSGSITYVTGNTAKGTWGFSGSGYAVGSGAFVSLTIDAILDTGTTLLLLPTSVVSAYYKQVTGAKYDATQGGYTFPCSAKLPDLVLGIGSYRATVPGSYINFAPTTSGGTTCFGGLQDNSGIGFSIYGLVFIKSQYVVFKGTSSPSLGFAKKA